jgi:ATP-dependent DNA helicase PIF1
MSKINNETLNDKQLLAFDVMKNGHNVFLTGPGGSGKSYLQKIFIDWFEETNTYINDEIHVTSTTGLSALLINGITIHRFFGIGTGEKEASEYIKLLKYKPDVVETLKNTKVLIIDEISMMDGELFDKLNVIAKKVRKNKKPFGGIQMIISGDFLQLQPVKKNIFCYESEAWKELDLKIFYFDKIIRQSDEALQNVLNKIRIGKIDDDVKEILNSRLNKEIINNLNILPSILFSKKDMVENYNNKELKKLIKTGAVNKTFKSKYKFKCLNNSVITDDKKEKLKKNIDIHYNNIDDDLLLAIDTQVMLIINIPQNKLANGSTGKVINFSENNYPIVSFLNGEILEIKPFDYELTDDDYIITKKQLPLIHSWAITIHKAQGMSLDFIKTDIGDSIFEFGQAYVVLSRIKTLQGLSLINIDYKKIKAHPKNLLYYDNLKKI